MSFLQISAVIVYEGACTVTLILIRHGSNGRQVKPEVFGTRTRLLMKNPPLFA